MTPREGFPRGTPQTPLWRESGGHRASSTCFLSAHQRLLSSLLPGRLRPRQTFPGTELWQRRHPSLLAHQETPIRHPEQVQAGGWVGRDGRIWLGPRWAGEVVSSQLFSPQVRRTLIPWTERQTDRQTPTPPSALLSRLPRGFLPKSLWRSCKEVWPQAPGPGEGEAWALPLHPYRSLYLQGHPNTDTYKYTPSMHTCP